MRYLSMFLGIGMTLSIATSSLASQPSVPPALADEACVSSAPRAESVVIGPSPLHTTVIQIDYANATVDFLTEAGTILHVTQASPSQLEMFQIGDEVKMCIAEELYGDSEV